MTPLYTGYALLTSIIFIIALPFALIYAGVTGRYKDHLAERLGFIPRKTIAGLRGRPRIWIHAVSLGEVRAADAIITALKKRIPGCSIMLSTTTKHGRELAASLDPENIQVAYLPIDSVLCVRTALSRVRPDALVFVETEIWPAWVFEAERLGIPLAMVNGRISPRSFVSYRRLRPLLKHVLDKFDIFSMIRPEDKKRITAMGAPQERVVVSGNAKYEKITTDLDPGTEEKMLRVLDLPKDARIIVAGSTREDEEKMVLEAYEIVLREFPDTILIIAPRHIERTGAIGTMLNKKGYSFSSRTQLGDQAGARKSNIIIIDTFGELFDTYSTATVVFCGASLVPLGGQNPLEPAAWGKPVLYGPSMEDFLDAREILENAGGGITVSDARSLGDEITGLFKNHQHLFTTGEKAKNAVFEHSSAGDNHAAYIEKLIVNPRRNSQ